MHKICPNVPLSSGHRVIDITKGHFIHTGPLEGIGVSIYLHNEKITQLNGSIIPYAQDNISPNNYTLATCGFHKLRQVSTPCLGAQSVKVPETLDASSLQFISVRGCLRSE
jgi:hypothetical protein